MCIYEACIRYWDSVQHWLFHCRVPVPSCKLSTLGSQTFVLCTCIHCASCALVPIVKLFTVKLHLARLKDPILMCYIQQVLSWSKNYCKRMTVWEMKVHGCIGVWWQLNNWQEQRVQMIWYKQKYQEGDIEKAQRIIHAQIIKQWYGCQ